MSRICFRMIGLFGLLVLSLAAQGGEFTARYFGGVGTDRGQAVAVGRSGDIYIAGTTDSAELPNTSGAQKQNITPGYKDIYIARYSQDLKSLIRVTYLGIAGVGDNFFGRMLVHPKTGDIYILAGNLIYVLSEDLSRTRNILSHPITTMADGSFLMAFDFDVNFQTGDIYVVGTFARAPDSKFAYISDENHFISIPENALNGKHAFIMRFSSSLQPISVAALGGVEQYSDTEFRSVKVSPGDGTIFAGGVSDSALSHLAQSRGRPVYGGTDGIIAVYSADLRELNAFTRVGGSNTDVISQLAFSNDGANIYALGLSGSISFPGVNTIRSRVSGYDHYIVKLPINLQAVDVATFLRSPFAEINEMFGNGASYYQQGGEKSALLINPADGSVDVGLFNTSAENLSGQSRFTTTSQGAANSEIQLFRLSSDLNEMQKSSLIGGRAHEGDPALAVNSSGSHLYLVATTFSDDFPGVVNAPISSQGDNSGRSDAILLEFSGDFVIDDNSPESFTFPRISGQRRGVFVKSSPVLIAGLDGATTISASGKGGYSIGCSNVQTDYSNGPGVVKNNDVVCVGHLTSSNFSAEDTTALAVGLHEAAFTSTTEVVDEYPDDLYRDNNEYQRQSVEQQLVQWGVLTISGINTEVDVSVRGGEYALNCVTPDANSNYTSATTSNVTAGTTICVRQTVGKSGQTTSTILTIGTREFLFESSAISLKKKNGGGGGGGSTALVVMVILWAGIRRAHRAYR